MGRLASAEGAMPASCLAESHKAGPGMMGSSSTALPAPTCRAGSRPAASSCSTLCLTPQVGAAPAMSVVRRSQRSGGSMPPSGCCSCCWPWLACCLRSCPAAAAGRLSVAGGGPARKCSSCRRVASSMKSSITTAGQSTGWVYCSELQAYYPEGRHGLRGCQHRAGY